MEEIAEAASALRVPIVRRTGEELGVLVGDMTHQGVVAEVEPYKYVGLDDLLATTKSQSRALLIALDGVTDPQNLGAIVRTAVGAGADGLLVPKHRASPVTAAVAKASAGLVEHASIAQTNLTAAIEKCKNAGYWVIGAHADAAAAIWDIDLSAKMVLVLGGEGRGLSTLVKSKCDFLAGLPMSGDVESLNVSAAAAVMIYEFVRQGYRREGESIEANNNC